MSKENKLKKTVIVEMAIADFLEIAQVGFDDYNSPMKIDGEIMDITLSGADESTAILTIRPRVEADSE